MTAEPSGERVIIRDEGKVIAQMSGEEALKLAHDLMDAGDKVLEATGRVHED